MAKTSSWTQNSSKRWHHLQLGKTIIFVKFLPRSNLNHFMAMIGEYGVILIQLGKRYTE